METGVMKMTTGRVPMGTQPAASVHQRGAAEGIPETTVTCMMSSTVEMHVVRLKTGTESRSVTSSTMTGTMTIMVLFMTNLTGSALQEGGTFREVLRLILET
jgi:hypothetical protein